MRRLRFVFIALLFSSAFVACTTAPTTNPWGAPTKSRDPRGFVISPDLFMRVSFIERAKPSLSGSYLAQNLHYPSFADLRKSLQIRLGQTLRHRDEAHLTILSPPEMENALLTRLSLDEIHAMARDADVQGFEFEPLCVGRAQARIEAEPLEAYFIVVRAEQARELRRQIHARFVERGGDPAAFAPEKYDPHITVGFIGRDLHLQDGIRKDSSSCWQPLYVDQP